MYLFTVVYCLRRFEPSLFSAPEMFIPDVCGMKNRRRKPARENGVDLWRRFLERVVPYMSVKIVLSV